MNLVFPVRNDKWRLVSVAPKEKQVQASTRTTTTFLLSSSFLLRSSLGCYLVWVCVVFQLEQKSSSSAISNKVSGNVCFRYYHLNLCYGTTYICYARLSLSLPLSLCFFRKLGNLLARPGLDLAMQSTR